MKSKMRITGNRTVIGITVLSSLSVSHSGLHLLSTASPTEKWKWYR